MFTPKMTTNSAARRGSLFLPLLESSGMHSPCFVSSATAFSPMSDLAMNLSGLSTSVGTTPKRKLSLSLDVSTPRPSSTSSDAGCCLDSPSPIESPSIQLSFEEHCFSFTTMHDTDNECIQSDQLLHNDNNSNGSSSSGFQSDSENSNDGENFSNIIDRKKLVVKRPSAFKRINSMPGNFGRGKISQSNNSAITTFQENITPFLDKENFTQVQTSSKTRPSVKDDFKFVEPLPPRRPLLCSNIYSGLSSPKKRPTSAPALLFNCGSPVLLSKSSLTSTEEDEEDDGFLDFIDTDVVEQDNPMEISCMSDLLTAPIKSESGTDCIDGCIDLALSIPTCDADTPVLGSRTKRGLFRSPSVPCEMSRTESGLRRSSSFLKRPERPVDVNSPIQCKRRCSISSPESFSRSSQGSTKCTTLHKSKSIADMDHIDKALMVGGDQQNLIGDFTKPYVLPLIKGKHQDLKSISSDTMVRVLNNEYADDIEYTIIDCRYPYEYKGGHIQGAKNIYTKDAIMNEFMKPGSQKTNGKRHVLIFHCEFSSERAPKLHRFLRNKDRDANKDNYPALNYPELYLLHGGYKAFYASYKDLCEPRDYVIMLHKDHSNDLRYFRLKSKSWAGERSSRTGLSARFKNC